MKTTATKLQLDEALNCVNQKFDDNIQFKNFEQISKKYISFTLTVKNSSAPGSRRAQSGRKIAAACWHAHGYFFEYLFLKYNDIVIYSLGVKMTSNSDNWKGATNISNLCTC